MTTISEFMRPMEGKEEPINWLMYKSYEFQRDNAPHIEATRWRKLYLYAEKYEKIYQKQRSKKNVSTS